MSSIPGRADNTHPFVPARLKQLAAFAGSADYPKILAAEYEKDPLGLHEAGSRITRACGLKVNSRLCFCLECGRELAPPEPAAIPAAPETPQDSKLEKLKGSAAGFFRR